MPQPRLLVVDDDPSVRSVVRTAMIVEGYAVEEADDGLDAIAALSCAQFDIVILDLGLPRAGGEQVLATVRALPGHDTTQVLLLTGDHDARRLRTCLEAGAQDYLRKPFEHDELVGRVAACQRTKDKLDALRKSSLHDSLTGLLNRRGGEHELRRWGAHSLRHQEPLSVMMIDIDFFKKVNDEHGHPTGDEVLTEVGRRLKSCVRASDVVVRWGGEEFLLVLPNTSAARACELADRVRHAVSGAAIDVHRQRLDVTVSVGIACATGGVGDPEKHTDALVAQADADLYASRQLLRASEPVTPVDRSRSG